MNFLVLEKTRLVLGQHSECCRDCYGSTEIKRSIMSKYRHLISTKPLGHGRIVCTAIYCSLIINVLTAVGRAKWFCRNGSKPRRKYDLFMWIILS